MSLRAAICTSLVYGNCSFGLGLSVSSPAIFSKVTSICSRKEAGTTTDLMRNSKALEEAEYLSITSLHTPPVDHLSLSLNRQRNSGLALQ